MRRPRPPVPTPRGSDTALSTQVLISREARAASCPSSPRFSGPSIAPPPCDIPCGIYDPHHAQLAAHTVIRMNLLINELKKPGPNAAAEERQDYANKLSRYVATKEQHAEIAKHEVRILWAAYFKPQHLQK